MSDRIDPEKIAKAYRQVMENYATSLIADGFDKSHVYEEQIDRAPMVSIQCSQCQAVTINRVPCHEHGCPNRKRNQ